MRGAKAEDYRRRRFLEEANRAFTVLRADSEKWQIELAEREAWNATISDNLAEE